MRTNIGSHVVMLLLAAALVPSMAFAEQAGPGEQTKQVEDALAGGKRSWWVPTIAQTGATSQQPPAPSRPAVMMPGPTVFVLEGNNPEVKGRLLRLDTREVVILVDGNERRFDLSQVRRVQKRGDSLKNGAITGAIVGVLGGLGASQLTDDAGEAVVAFFVATAVYTAIGTGIDALIQGRTTLYQAPMVTAKASRPAARPTALTIRLSW